MLHFGLGAKTSVDSLIVVWPGGKVSRQYVVKVDQQLTLDPADGETLAWSLTETGQPLFEQVEEHMHVHEETVYDDFKLELLLPHKMSELGPGLASGDANGDKLQDLFHYRFA